MSSRRSSARPQWRKNASPIAPAASAVRSMPEQNARPSPRTTTRLTSRSAPPAPALARYVRGRALTPVREGRLRLYARALYGTGGTRPTEPIAGGAPFVTFVQEGGPLGVTPRVTYVRIPWHPRMINRTWLMGLRMELGGLVRPVPATWIERLFWGRRHTLALSYNEVRGRGIFPMYFEHRDRLLRLADEPSQLLATFSRAEQLRIHDVFPRTASRRAAEARVATEIVSLFLDPAPGARPPVLTRPVGSSTPNRKNQP